MGTSVAFAEDTIKVDGHDGINSFSYGILGVGTESGRIEVWAVPLPSLSAVDPFNNEHECPNPILLYAIPSNDCHFGSVKKVSWRPNAGVHTSSEGMNDNRVLKELTLATCGKDNGVRIFNLTIR